MMANISNIFYWIAAGILILAGVFILRFFLRFAWKIVRFVLIAASLLIIVGYFFGFFDIIFH